MKVLLRLCLVAALLLAGCGEDSEPTRNNDFVPLTGITVTSEQAQIPAGFTNQFTATGNFSGAFTRPVTSEVTWSSSNPGILIFDNPNNGVARSVVPGTVTVTAAGGGVAGTLDFTVSSATLQAIAVTPDPVNVSRGRTQQFTATGTFSDASALDITALASWQSSAPAVATVNATGLATGVAVGGPVAITAGFPAAAPTISGSAQMTVTAPIVESIRVTPATPVLTPGETQQFTATALLSDGSESPVASATWSSSNAGAATIDTTGLATAAANGTTTISALDSASGLTGSTTLNVATVTSISITPQNASVSVGSELPLTATATLSNGSTRDITAVATWTTNRQDIAAVGNETTNKGRVTGIAAGTATITATRTVNATTNVTVTLPTP